MKKYKFDLHTHHERCGHAEQPIRNYIEAAIEKGLHIIGISDHSPFFASQEDHFLPSIAMAKSEFPNYVNEILQLKKEYEGKIEVLLGIEADFFPMHIETYRQYLDRYPFDYIIGSVHYVNDLQIFTKNIWDDLTQSQKIKLKEEYYNLIEQSARSNTFQILGHIDAMKGYYPAFSSIQTDVIDQTLKVIAQCGIAIEVNTSGKMKSCGGWYPADDILARALYYGVDITFGSDAHSPDRVGDDFDFVQKHLQEIGFEEWVYFKEKQRYAIKL